MPAPCTVKSQLRSCPCACMTLSDRIFHDSFKYSSKSFMEGLTRIVPNYSAFRKRNDSMQPTASRRYARSQLSIRLVERNRVFDIAAWIQNPNLTGAKARAVLRIIDCLIFLQKNPDLPSARYQSLK